MSNKKNSLPDFMLIGAAKGGTSSLYFYLCRHPQLYLSELKEPEYFSREAVNAQGVDWYKNLFKNAQADQLVGEASTGYTRWPHTLDSSKLIADSLPDLKMIYMMRHPVERAFSHYKHDMRGGVTMTFEEALKKDCKYTDISLYMFQIKRYLRFYARGHFLFLFQSDLRENPEEVLYRIEEFLGVDKIDLVSKGIIQRNVNGSNYYVRAKTTDWINKIPLLRYIKEMVPKQKRVYLFNQLIYNGFIGRRLRGKCRIDPMKPETRAHLLELFEESTCDLETFLEIDLDAWRH